MNTISENDTLQKLLCRQQADLSDADTAGYYGGKTVLITGGGGSIGGELCRQIAGMYPRRLIVLDICENGAYGIQQELLMQYGADFPVSVEILSVCERGALEAVFAEYRPQIVIHAAAHKHVPLMEHNCCEAIRNNIFGTLHTADLAEAYDAERFVLISTDKAVRPTNVMGATKRMCEMMLLSRGGKTVFSAVRFGNVLGSAGSVIPLFERQIDAGGPITLTDRRIIRYFMTIPEASALVLRCGSMAERGELFVLDMGEPVRILDLAEALIRRRGLEPHIDIEIRETGLRPGEKMYEELLRNPEKQKKTACEQIFIEQADIASPEEIAQKLTDLRAAAASENWEAARRALMRAVPEYGEMIGNTV